MDIHRRIGALENSLHLPDPQRGMEPGHDPESGVRGGSYPAGSEMLLVPGVLHEDCPSGTSRP